MIIIPIGFQCSSATFLKYINKRTESYPFDWVFATPEFVYKMLDLLLTENMDINDLVKTHFFNCNKRAFSFIVEHYYTCCYGPALYNEKYNIIFPHDSYNDETIKKYIRRFKRLKDVILNSIDEICFIYTSQSSLKIGNHTINGIDVVNDVYKNLNNIYELIGKYRKEDKKYKMVLFDAIQNDKDLNENIILCKIDKCNFWVNLLPQMKKYQEHFNNNDEIWKNNLNKVKQYIGLKQNSKLLSEWINDQFKKEDNMYQRNKSLVNWIIYKLKNEYTNEQENKLFIEYISYQIDNEYTIYQQNKSLIEWISYQLKNKNNILNENIKDEYICFIKEFFPNDINAIEHTKMYISNAHSLKMD
jgi:hypothetical protein